MLRAVLLPLLQALWLCEVYLILARLPARAEGSAAPLTTCAEVRTLPLAEGAQGLPVRVQGIVTYSDPARRQLFIQDGAAAVSIRSAAARPGPESDVWPGQRIEVEGVTTRGRLHCGILSRSIRVIGDGQMPPPLELGGPELAAEAAESRWVRVRGWIPSLTKSGDRLSLELILGPGQALGLTVLSGDAPEARDLPGAVVEAEGVFTSRFDGAGKPAGGRLFASDLTGLHKLNSIPVSTIRAAGQVPGNSMPGEPVRLRGQVMAHSLGHFLLVKDRSSSLRVPFPNLTYFNAGTLVEILACPLQRTPDLILTNVTIKPVLAGRVDEELTPAIVAPTSANTNLPTLTQVMQVRRLSPQEASRGYPVRITGVVTCWDIPTFLFFVQDDSSGIYIDPGRLESRPAFALGRTVQVDGFSGPGDYAPVIVAQKMRDVRDGVLPQPVLATFQKLMTGEYDSQWVFLRGVVRNQWTQTNATFLAVSTGDNVIKVGVRTSATPPTTTNLIDAGVEIQGVCSTIFDDHRRLQNVELQVPGWNQVHVKEPAPPDPFLLPVVSAGELLEFHLGGRELHRVHMMGVINLRQPDGSFYLQDASGGIQVQPIQSLASVEVGSTFEVVGFPVIVGRHPALQDAQVRPLQGGIAVESSELKLESPLDNALHGTLVRLDGQVLGHFSRPDEESLTLQFGQFITEATLPKTNPQDLLAAVVPTSTIRLHGVYLARLDEEGNVQSFQIELRAPDDVVVLSRPPRWTMRHVAYAAGGLAAVLLLALAWGTALRRQVKQRTRELHQEIQQHERAEAQLESEILERKHMESEIEKTHQQLITASREAGKAEVATSILHNVGNVLNSVNVSANLITDQVKQSRVANFDLAARMLADHASDLPQFLTADPKGQQLTLYLPRLAQHLTQEQTTALAELESLRKHIEHIKEIVAVQQGYAKTSGVVEVVKPADLVEDALRINEESLVRHHVQVRREYDPHVPNIAIDKHKLLQIVVNLIGNADIACNDSGRPDRCIVARVANGGDHIKISVTDNGVGILPENLTRIFTHGFTTRKDGHGFGLHSGALAAREMGGALLTQSRGAGQGATFTIQLPLALAHPGPK